MRLQEVDFLFRIGSLIRADLGDVPINNIFYTGEPRLLYVDGKNLELKPYTYHGWVLSAGYDERTGALYVFYPDD